MYRIISSLRFNCLQAAQSGGSFVCCVLIVCVCSFPIWAQRDNAVPSSSGAVLNRYLPEWIQLNGEYRARWEAQDGIGFAPADDGYGLSRLTLRLTIHPANWVQFMAETQDSRIFLNGAVSTKPPYQNNFDIHQAYVRLGDRDRGWLDLTAGRQEIALGGERLVGPAQWSNSPRVFDSVRLGIHHRKARLDLIASSVVQVRDGTLDHHSQGDNLHAAYFSYNDLIPKSVVEAYYFWRLAPAALIPGEISERGHLNEKTFGARWVGRLPARFDYEMEMARQFGTVGASSIESWAGYWTFGRQLNIRFTPRIFLQYNFASGDNTARDGVTGTFDQLFPSAHDKLGLADLIGWRNIHNLQTGATFKPARNWKAKALYHNYWLASTHDNLYGSNSAIAIANPGGNLPSYVGQELDFQGTWNPNPALEIGFGLAHFFTGDFVNRVSQGKDFNYPYLVAAYRF